MKTKIKLVSLATVAILLLIALPVYAKTSTTIIPKAPAAGSSFAERLAQRKAEQHLKLSAQTKQHITEACVNTQTKLRLLADQTATVVSNRLNVYGTIDGKLWVIIGEIKLANKNTLSLEKDHTTYSAKVTAFKTTTDLYSQSLGDLALVKCQTDPVGFQALLNTARYYYGQIRAESLDIANYVSITIKTELNNYSTQLQPQLNSQGQ